MERVIHDDRATGNGLATRGMPMVLMYHSVQPYTEDPYLVTVGPPRFEQQMRWLRRRGLRGVSIAELLAARAAGAGKGLVGLTFDDGYADFAEYALPVLRRYGFTATVFVIAGRMGGDNVWDPAGPRKPLLDADQVRALAEAGVEIGSHGLMHVSLPAAHRRAGRRDRRQPAHPAGRHRPAGRWILLPVRPSRRRGGRRGPRRGLRLRLRHLAVGARRPARAAANLHRRRRQLAPALGQGDAAPAGPGPGGLNIPHSA